MSKKYELLPGVAVMYWADDAPETDFRRPPLIASAPGVQDHAVPPGRPMSGECPLNSPLPANVSRKNVVTDYRVGSAMLYASITWVAADTSDTEARLISPPASATTP